MKKTSSMISMTSLRSVESCGSMSSLVLAEIEETEDKLLTRLLHILKEEGSVDESINEFMTLLKYVCSLCSTLVYDKEYTSNAWTPCVVPYLTALLSEEEAKKTSARFLLESSQFAERERLAKFGIKEEALGEEVCDIDFSLAYGGKVLLHNTKLLLHRGRRYGLLGHNGAGKTTLMRNIANGKIEGMPNGLKFVFVESHFDDDNLEEMPVLEYVLNEPLISGLLESQVEQMLRGVGFNDEKLMGPTSALSGGWRMKLALARAILINPDILLLDEPTNHLDIKTVQWLVDHMQQQTHATVLIVSHDTGFLDKVCTDIIHYENQKLVRYPGNLSAFVDMKPECRSYYELASTGGLQFKFPNPGRLDGISSTTRAIARMENVDFTYPGSEKATLTGVNCHVCLGSRVAILGPNGAGKSTLIKMLVGETLPSNKAAGGSVWKHHNLRIAYVAQHSFHHVEEHLEKSPVEYFQWRFKDGGDREMLAREAYQNEEGAELGEKYGQIEYLHSRRLRHGVLEYECKFVGMREKDNKYLTRDVIAAMGLTGLMRQVDERVAAEQAGIFSEVGLRTTTSIEVQKHLDDFNLAMEFGTYGKIKGLSGGQKVKLVLASAFWQLPHLLVLDEPTNYLDREALGALADAIKSFGGGVLMISHNQEFYGALCSEVWNVDAGILRREGEVEEKTLKVTREKTDKEKLMAKKEETKQVVGGSSNTNETKDRVLLINEKTGRPLSNKEIRALAKAKAKQEKAAAKAAKGK